MNTSKYFKGNIHAFFMITIVTNTAWCHKTIRTFFSVSLKICSPAGAVNILSVVISIALFCCFPFFTGCEKNLPNFKHLFKWNLSGVCCYVTNAGLSPSVRATEKSIEKIPQSTWFNLCCTGGTLTDVLLLAGRIMSHILCKILEKYFEILWILKTNFTFLISRNCYPVIVSIQYLKKTTFLTVNIFIKPNSVSSRPTIIFIIFWDVFTFYQIFLSLQVKICAIITYKHNIYAYHNELPNDLRFRFLEN